MQRKSRDRFADAALAAATNRRKHGEDFYKKISSMGGKVCGVRKGFAANRELAKIAGRKGGRKSKKGAKK